MKNDQDGRAWALAAQALAHAYRNVQDASHRAGSSTPTDHNKKLLQQIYKMEHKLLLLTKRAAKARDKADGY